MGVGLQDDDNAFARTAFEEIEPGGHFLGSAHTMANYSDAFYEAELSNSDNVENWEANGAKDMRVRAFEKWNRMLGDYQQPALDQAKREELEAYVTRRKEELPDAWY